MSTQSLSSYDPDQLTSGTYMGLPLPSTMLNSMLSQLLDNLITGNQDLKQTIKVNNEELYSKCESLLKWKKDVDDKVKKLFDTCDRARVKVQSMKEQNALLLGENTRLKIQLEQPTNKPAENGEVDDVTEEQMVGNRMEETQRRYMQVVGSIENQLKEVMAERDTLKQSCLKLRNDNQTLQSTIQSDRIQLEQLHQMHEDKQLLVNRINGLENDIELYKRRHADSEKTEKELKRQFHSLVEENKVFQKQGLDLKLQNDAARKEINDLGIIISHKNDQVQQVEKEKQNLQEAKDKIISKQKNEVQEKCRAIDDLFVEYNNVREQKDRLTAEHALWKSQRSEYDNVYAQLICAEESLQKKDREIKELGEQVKKEGKETLMKMKKLEENVSFFKAQADVFRQDFLIEREDRGKLHDTNLQLQASLYEKERIVDQLKNQLEQYRYDAMRR
uniref:NF-kappa-B essential modulator n=1 Tax=Ciona intestinalis TaxID=7719 RepID=F7BJ31_CIOIN|nr:NF-kappa-B essential modulator [Ciona intestinalis]|eukprot:XP_002128869.1 NF-kappa-B essential modulator [Ciona intestinalis]